MLPVLDGTVPALYKAGRSNRQAKTQHVLGCGIPFIGVRFCAFAARKIVGRKGFKIACHDAAPIFHGRRVAVLVVVKKIQAFGQGIGIGDYLLGFSQIFTLGPAGRR